MCSSDLSDAWTVVGHSAAPPAWWTPRLSSIGAGYDSQPPGPAEAGGPDEGVVAEVGGPTTVVDDGGRGPVPDVVEEPARTVVVVATVVVAATVVVVRSAPGGTVALRSRRSVRSIR